MRGGCSPFGGTHLVTELPSLLRQMPLLVTSATVWLIDHVSCDDKLVSDMFALFFQTYCVISTDVTFRRLVYRGVNKGLYVLLSRNQAGLGRAVKQEQEEISHSHVQTFIYLSVL